MLLVLNIESSGKDLKKTSAASINTSEATESAVGDQLLYVGLHSVHTLIVRDI